MTEKEKFTELNAMLENLLKNVESVKFGEVVLSLRIHDYRIVAVTNSVTQNSIEKRR